MLPQSLSDPIRHARSGSQTAPLLVSESQVCNILEVIFGKEYTNLELLADETIMDCVYYDCGNKEDKQHSIEQIRLVCEKLYQKPAGDILVAIFRDLDVLTDKAQNALLRIFEDTPAQLLILVTSQAPEKIIPTLRSRMVIISNSRESRGENPLQAEVDAFLEGKPEALFSLTLAPSKESKFNREDALWIVSGLQDAIECGRLPTGCAKTVIQTRLALENTNTIAKYLIDQLLITLSCDISTHS